MTHDDCPLITDHISIPERTKSDEVLELSNEDHQIIDGEINQHQDGSKERIKKKLCHGDKYKIKSKQYVGIATLPSGSTIEVYPKIANENGPYIISYAYETGDVVTADANTGIIGGSSILLPLATSFSSKTSEILRTHQIDKNRETRYSSSRGRLNARAFIRMKSGNHSARNRMFKQQVTKHDTPANRVLYEGALRYKKVLNQDTQEYADRIETLETLIKKFSQRNVQRPKDLEGLLNEVQRNPPNRLYDALFDLVSPALYVEGIDLSQGETPSHSYFINMDAVFESLVERAIKSRFRPEYRIEAQEDRQNAFEGPSSIGIRPDLVMLEGGDEICVIDAKWQDSISNKDFHKSLSYGAHYDAPSVMIYPETGEEPLSGEFDVPAAPNVHTVEVPVGTDVSDYGEFKDIVEKKTKDNIPTII